MASNKEFSTQLEQRTLNFSVFVLKFLATLPKTTECVVVRNQLAKSATSVGANYREANRSRSQKDFKNKISICVSEASETLYWLEIVEAMDWGAEMIILDLKKESKELLALFTSIHQKLNNKNF